MDEGDSLSTESKYFDKIDNVRLSDDGKAVVIIDQTLRLVMLYGRFAKGKWTEIKV